MQGICKKILLLLGLPEITGKYEYYTTITRTFVPDCLCAMYLYSITYSRLREGDLKSLCQKHSTAL